MRNRLPALTLALLGVAAAWLATASAGYAGCFGSSCQAHAGYAYGYAYAAPAYPQVYQPVYQQATGALPVPPPRPFYYSYSRSYEGECCGASFFGGLLDRGSCCAAPSAPPPCCAAAPYGIAAVQTAPPVVYAAPGYAEPAYYAAQAHAPGHAQPAYAQPAYVAGGVQQGYFQQGYPYPEPAFAQRGYANMESYAEPGAHRQAGRKPPSRRVASSAPRRKPSSSNPSTSLSGREVAPGRVLTP